MKTTTLNVLKTAGFDTYNPTELFELAKGLERRALILSNVSDDIVKSMLTEEQISALAKLPEHYTIGKVMSQTKNEIRAQVGADVGNVIIDAFIDKGLYFSEGCIYCHSTSCVAYLYGESVCGCAD